MDKLKLAHDYLLKIMSNSPLVDQVDIEFAVSTAWSYARMMHSEKIKEDKTDSEQKRKEVREILNDANTFIEREGQHFDDVEWQPDWSQAPDEANMITIDACGVGQYWVMYQGNEPKLGDNRWFDDYRGRYLGGFEPVGFNGNWKDSLRKRP